MTIPVERAVGRLFEHCSHGITGCELRELGTSGELLLRWGAIVEADPLAVICCRACDRDHEAEIVFEHSSGTYRYYCGSAGFQDVPPEDVQSFFFNPSWLAARIAGSLPIRRPRQRELVVQTLWDLGDAEFGEAGSSKRPWAAFLARTVLPRVDAIVEELRARGRKLPGFVLTSSADAP